MADRTVAAIYRRHNEAYPLMAVDAPRLELEAFARELQQLRLRADHFRLRPSTLLTEQHSLTRRFLGTLAQSVVDLHRRLRGAIERWEAEVLLPLLQFNQERKQLLEQQLLEMRALAQASRQARTRGQMLGRYAEQLAQQREEVEELLRSLQRCAPAPQYGNVVQLPLAR